MSKITSKKQPSAAPAKKKKRPQRNWRQTIIIGVMLLALAGMLLPNIIPNFSGNKAARNISTNSANNMPPEPKFTKEGELSFISGETGQAIKTIDIEKADNDMERSFGLMYRRSIPDTQGMLFLFDHSEPQSFWMRNTLVPLDIMFVDENKKILNIHENTKPFSEASLPSKGNAQYVVEVPGGFSAKYGVKPGDVISWQ